MILIWEEKHDCLSEEVLLLKEKSKHVLLLFFLMIWGAINVFDLRILHKSWNFLISLCGGLVNIFSSLGVRNFICNGVTLPFEMLFSCDTLHIIFSAKCDVTKFAFALSW